MQQPVVENEVDARDTQLQLLSVKVEQHSVNLAVEAQKREALEAELRQSLTETRVELRQLQQSRAKAIDAIKQVKDRCERLNSQYTLFIKLPLLGCDEMSTDSLTICWHRAE